MKQEAYIRQMMTGRWGVCHYNDLTHTYTVNGKVVPSITTLKKTVCPHFDAPAILAKMSKKTGRTAEEIQAEWTAIADCGTMLHELLESVLFGGKIKRPTDWSRYSEIAHARLLRYKQGDLPAGMIQCVLDRGWTPVGAEMTLWTADAGGTLDLLCIDKLGVMHVVDWKSNAKGGMAKTTPWTEKLSGPFAGLSATKLAEYSVQLESYAVMLEMLGLQVGCGLIVHAYFDELGLPTIDCHETLDLRPGCRKFLGDMRKKTTKKEGGK